MNKKLLSLLIIISMLILAGGFSKKRASTQGPGLGSVTFSQNELFQQIGSLTALNGAPLGHSHAMMFKGYLTMILAKDSGKKGGGFGFYDMSDPRNPQAVFTKVDLETEKIREGHGFGFFRTNGRDYCALQTISGIQIWDWTDVTNPFIWSDLSLPGVKESDYADGSWWVHAQAPYLYVGGSSNGIYVVDASNPVSPVLAKHLPISQTGNFRVGPIFAIGNLLVITSMDALGIATLDISNPANPTLLDTEFGLQTFIYSAIVNGDWIIGASKDNRIHLWDISNPSDIILFSSSPVMSGGGGYVNFQDGFVHAGMSDDYYKVDMRSPANMTLVGSGKSLIPNTDHDFASVIGNIVIVGNDHGTGSAIIAHDLEPDTTPPSVTKVNPAPDAVNQPLTSRIGITMSDGIDFASVNEQTFIVRPVGGLPLPGTYSYQLGILNFSPNTPLEANKVYEVVLPAGGLMDYAGNLTSEEFVSRFSTGNSLNLLGCFLEELPFVELGLSSFFEINPFNHDTSAGVSYAWNFGDGNTSAPSPDPFTHHVYQSVGTYTVIATIINGSSQSTCSILHTVFDKPEGAPPSTTSTIILDASGTSVWNVNPDNDLLTKTGVQPFAVLREIVTGKHPVSLAQDGSGNIWVANRDDATLQVFDNAGNLLQTITLPRGSQPAAITISPDKQTAFVSLYATGEVAKLNVTTRAVMEKKQVGAFPKGLAVSRDNKSLYITKFISDKDEGEVYLYNAETFTHIKTISLAYDQSTDSEFSGRGIPNYLNAITLSPDGRTAIIPSKKDNVYRGLQKDGKLLNFENTVRAILSTLNLASRSEDYNARIDINNGDSPAAVAFSKYGNLIFAAMQGNNHVDIFDAFRGNLVTTIEDVGAAPQGLVFSKTGDTLFVQNFLSRTVSAYNVYAIVNQVSTKITPIGEVKTVKKETMDATVLKGKKIFYNAKDERMGKDSYMSCASCHINGEHDGRTWDLSQLGEGIRNTIPLNGRAGLKHGNVHWTGNFDEIQDFEGQIRLLGAGLGFMHDADFQLGSRSEPLGDTKAGHSGDLDALAAYIASLEKFGDSPHRNADGTLTAAGERGKIIFANSNCGVCHSGADFTSSEMRVLHDIGSIKTTSGTRLEKQLLGFDSPTLKGLWLTAPYLHDGSAPTLHDALTSGNGTLFHGDAAQLSQQQLDDLVAYLLQLDDSEAGAHPHMELRIVKPEHFSLVKVNETIEVRLATGLQDITEIRYYLDGSEFARVADAQEKVSVAFSITGEHVLQAKVYHHGGKFASLTPETKVTVLKDDCDVQVTLIPNPVSDKLRLMMNGIHEAQIRLYDYSGKRWLNEVYVSASGVIDMSSLPHGVYLLRIDKGGCRVVKKVLRYSM